MFKGKTSFYTNKSSDPRWGGITKSGVKFDETMPTAAVLPNMYKDLKNKILRVENLKNGKVTFVRANDTGGFKKYGRVLDMSKSSFKKIADPKTGEIQASIEVLDNNNYAPINWDREAGE